jgi:pyrroloquinoline quinone biosynthesis protein D
MTAEIIPPTARPKIAARARLQTDKLTGEPMLLYPEGILKLNSTGHAIVQLCTGNATLGEIVSDLAARYRVSAEEISPQVNEYLQKLRTRNLVDITASP